MFADYRVPQILRAYGALVYSCDLAHTIDTHTEIPFGAVEETEIRACTVTAVELLRAALELKGRSLMSIELDWLLWQKGEAALATLSPPHKTLTIYY